MLRLGVFFSGLLLATVALAATWPYDEKADSPGEVRLALQRAKSEHKNVLLIFGANWCEDCRELDKALHRSKSDLIDSHFVVVKINVGQFDRNLDLDQRYGDPIKKGIPAAVVLTPSDRVLYVTRAGELANARSMSDASIFDFFSKVISGLRPEGG